MEWVEGRELKLNTDYETSVEFTDFKNEYFPDGAIKQNKFSDYLKKYANFMQHQIIKRKSNGKTYFQFKSVQK